MKRFLSGDWVIWAMVAGIVLLLLSPFLVVGVLLAKYASGHPEAKPVVRGLIGLFYLGVAARTVTNPTFFRRPGETQLSQRFAGAALSCLGLSYFVATGALQSFLIGASLLCWVVFFVKRPRKLFVAT